MKKTIVKILFYILLIGGAIVSVRLMMYKEDLMPKIGGVLALIGCVGLFYLDYKSKDKKKS